MALPFLIPSNLKLNDDVTREILKQYSDIIQYERESGKHLPVGSKNFLDRKKLSANPSIFTIYQRPL
jgi:hypothetical protein